MTRARNGAASRRKGVSWEREVARDLRSATAFVVRRRGQADQWKDGAIDAPDVEVVSPRHLSAIVAVECKAGYAINLTRALSQLDALAPSTPGALHVVAARSQADGRTARHVAVVPWEEFLHLLACATLPLPRNQAVLSRHDAQP